MTSSSSRRPRAGSQIFPRPSTASSTETHPTRPQGPCASPPVRTSLSETHLHGSVPHAHRNPGRYPLCPPNPRSIRVAHPTPVQERVRTKVRPQVPVQTQYLSTNTPVVPLTWFRPVRRDKSLCRPVSRRQVHAYHERETKRLIRTNEGMSCVSSTVGVV